MYNDTKWANLFAMRLKMHRIGGHLLQEHQGKHAHGKKHTNENEKKNQMTKTKPIPLHTHVCTVHRASTMNDKLCINLNLLTFMLNVLILILLTNTFFCNLLHKRTIDLHRIPINGKKYFEFGLRSPLRKQTKKLII